MSETPIHDFNKLKSALTNLGFTIGEAKPYRPLDIADVDLSNIQSGEVEITDEGIFYINPDTGTKQQIFLYKKAVFLEYRGVRKKPSMHLTNCEAIQDWGQNQYRRANTGSVIVWDKSSHREVEVSGLPLCSYCRRKMFLTESSIDLVRTSDDFEQILREAGNKKSERRENDTDLEGYIWEWQKISQAYRTKKNYTCEICGFSPNNRMDRQYIHVHHKDGIKTNNNESNLQCLCIACHSKVNQSHQENFSKGANKIMLESFKKKYPKAGQERHTVFSDGDLPF